MSHDCICNHNCCCCYEESAQRWEAEARRLDAELHRFTEAHVMLAGRANRDAAMLDAVRIALTTPNKPSPK